MMKNVGVYTLNQDRGHVQHKIFHGIYFLLLLICHLILVALLGRQEFNLIGVQQV